MIRIDQTRDATARSVRRACLLVALTSLAVPAFADGPHPLEVAARFLSLSDEQVAGVIAIEQAFQEAGAPVVEELAQRKMLLEELIASDPPEPPRIGVVVLSIRTLEHQLAALRQEATGHLHELLDADQLERLQAAAEARPLCHFLPALAALHLL